MGGTAKQAVDAASMAIQNMIGLVCDPVADRVEVPCLGKNVSAAMNALSSATMACSGFDAVIPLDEVIQTVSRVSAQMPTCVKCTGQGGLAITDTSRRLKDKLIKIMELCPDLRSLYLLKEEFRTIFEKVRCREKAARFLDVWILKAKGTGDKYLAKFIATLGKWRAQILNYFLERITNGFVEGTNNALRSVIRTAFGYRNFNNFKLRVLAEFGPFHANPR